MKLGEARRWLESNFGSQKRFEASERKGLSELEFVQALEHLQYFSIVRDRDRTTVERFLFSGCRKFNRWFAPSPPSVPENFSALHARFASALAGLEKVPTNAPVFLVHSLRDELYSMLAGRPFPIVGETLQLINNLDKRLQLIPVPESITKKQEMISAKFELSTLLDGIRSGSLRTILTTTVPYPLYRCPMELTFQIDGINVRAKVTSQFSWPSTTMVQTTPPNVLRPKGSTRWMYGYAAIEMEFEALVDASLQVPALQLPAVEKQNKGWPNGLRQAYEVIYQSCWAMRAHEQYIGTWVPVPGDLGDIESSIRVPGHSELNFIRRGHASVAFEVFTPSAEAGFVDLGKLVELEWFKRCRILANQYALIGEAREAIFWLNVGVEALLRHRMEVHIAISELDIDLDVLDGGKTYWDEAKRLVASNFPDVAEQIDWPTAGKKPSLFQQLKYYSNNLPDAPSFGSVKAHYSKVSRFRNALFHGARDTQIAIDDVRIAMESFDWLVDNFHQQAIT